MATSFITDSVEIIENTTGTDVLASGAINQVGTLYSVVVPQASGAPSVQQIIDGEDDSGTAVASGLADSEAASASGELVALSGYALTSDTSYTMYVAASGVDDGLIAAATDLDFDTPDITEPEFAAGYPNLSNITTTNVTIAYKLNEDGIGYFIIVPTADSALPTAAQIEAGTYASDVAIVDGLKGSTALSADTENTTIVSALAPSTQYTIYWVGADEGDNDTAISTAAFRASVRAALPGRYSMKNIVKDRQKLANQITNTLRA